MFLKIHEPPRKTIDNPLNVSLQLLAAQTRQLVNGRTTKRVAGSAMPSPDVHQFGDAAVFYVECKGAAGVELVAIFWNLFQSSRNI